MSKKRNKIKLNIEDQTTIYVKPGTTVGKALEESGIKFPYPVVGGMLDHKIVEIGRKIKYGGRLSAVHLGTTDGMRLYRRSLSFVLVRAVKDIFPDLKVYINHSLSKGYYCELLSAEYVNLNGFKLSREDVKRIRNRMQEIIDADEPFIRKEVPLEKGIRLFQRRRQKEKVRLLKYRQKVMKDKTISIYQCGPEKNHFYGYLVPSAGYLKVFDLKYYPPGFILRFPEKENPDELPEFVEQDKMFQVYQEYENWAKILGLETVSLLNELIESGGIDEFIKVAEALQEKKIAETADMITGHEHNPRIVLIGGPSCSGKTTFSKRLSIHLRVNGFRPVIISTDDFFVDREKTPRDEYGELDFEAFDAIDYRYLNRIIRDLLKGKTVWMPKFDFAAGRRKKGMKLHLDKNQILILEGIHSLNHRLLDIIPSGLKFRIYVSALTTLNIDYHNRVSTSDSRLLRRIVRDSQFRSYTASATLLRWPSVRRGEERNIFPYQENADVMFNSAHVYELGVLRQFVEPLLEKIPKKNPTHSEARRLLKFISYFRNVEVVKVPRHSILREFVGGSSFNY